MNNQENKPDFGRIIPRSNMEPSLKEYKNPVLPIIIKIIVGIIIIGVLVGVGYIWFNVISVKLNNDDKTIKKTNDTIKQSYKTNSYSYIESIEYNAGMAIIDSISIPGDGINDTICIKTVDGWNNECSEFMNKVDKNTRGKLPNEAKIILDSSGTIKNGSWLKYDKYYYNYNGSEIISISKQKPE